MATNSSDLTHEITNQRNNNNNNNNNGIVDVDGSFVCDGSVNDRFVVDSDNTFELESDDGSYYDKINKFKSSYCQNFKIVHLNINSLFNKIDELNFLIGNEFDIISLNETKLDSSIPLSFTSNIKYNTLRLDRNRHGGGILVLIKNNYQLVEQDIWQDFFTVRHFVVLVFSYFQSLLFNF